MGSGSEKLSEFLIFSLNPPKIKHLQGLSSTIKFTVTHLSESTYDSLPQPSVRVSGLSRLKLKIPMWKLNLLKCAYMCVVCLCTCSHVLVCVLEHQRSISRCLPQSLFFIFYFQVGFLTEVEGHQFSWTGWPLSSRDPVYLLPQCLEYRLNWYILIYTLDAGTHALGTSVSSAKLSAQAPK